MGTHRRQSGPRGTSFHDRRASRFSEGYEDALAVRALLSGASRPASKPDTTPMFFTEGLPSARNAAAYAARLNPMLSSGDVTQELTALGQIFDLIRKNDGAWKDILAIYKKYVAEQKNLDPVLWPKEKDELFLFNFLIQRRDGKAQTFAAIMDYTYYGIAQENIVEEVGGNNGLRAKQAMVLREGMIPKNFVLLREALQNYEGELLSDENRTKYLELVETLIGKSEAFADSLEDRNIQVKIEHLEGMPAYQKGIINPQLPALKGMIQDAHEYSKRIDPIASGLAQLAASNDQELLTNAIGAIFMEAFNGDDYRTNCEMWTKILEFGKQSEAIQDRAYYLLVRDLRQLQRELTEMDEFVNAEKTSGKKLDPKCDKGLKAWKTKVDAVCEAFKGYPEVPLPEETAFSKALKAYPPVAGVGAEEAEAPAVVAAPVVVESAANPELPASSLEQPAAPVELPPTLPNEALTPPSAAEQAPTEPEKPDGDAALMAGVAALAAAAAVVAAPPKSEAPNPPAAGAAETESPRKAPAAGASKPVPAVRPPAVGASKKVPVLRPKGGGKGAKSPAAATEAEKAEAFRQVVLDEFAAQDDQWKAYKAEEPKRRHQANALEGWKVYDQTVGAESVQQAQLGAMLAEHQKIDAQLAAINALGEGEKLEHPRVQAVWTALLAKRATDDATPAGSFVERVSGSPRASADTAAAAKEAIGQLVALLEDTGAKILANSDKLAYKGNPVTTPQKLVAASLAAASKDISTEDLAIQSYSGSTHYRNLAGQLKDTDTSTEQGIMNAAQLVTQVLEAMESTKASFQGRETDHERVYIDHYLTNGDQVIEALEAALESIPETPAIGGRE